MVGKGQLKHLIYSSKFYTVYMKYFSYLDSTSYKLSRDTKFIIFGLVDLFSMHFVSWVQNLVFEFEFELV